MGCKARSFYLKGLLSLPVTNAAATLIGHTVYIAGGETVTGASSQFLALGLNNTAAGWKQLAEIPQQVSHTVLMASVEQGTNTIYLCGGRNKNSSGISDLYSNVFKYDITTNIWQKKVITVCTKCRNGDDD